MTKLETDLKWNNFEKLFQEFNKLSFSFNLISLFFVDLGISFHKKGFNQ